jgi:hypothetical protein
VGAVVTDRDVLAALREPFPDDQVEHRPVVRCRACRAGNCIDHQVEICRVCKQAVSSAHQHLSYIGHARLTARLLEVDPRWFWEPLALTDSGLPLFDAHGGLWIVMVVHEEDGTEMRRIGYGDSGSNGGADGVKETIGDALRNAGMRFGMALELWDGDDRSLIDGIPGLPTGPAKDDRARCGT